MAGVRVIGLTGTIGSGKSVVRQLLAELGAHTVDADALVHRLYETDTALMAQLAARFGAGVVAGGRVDRQALARAVFGAPGAPADPQALAALEAIVHPAVLRLEDQEIQAARAAGRPACAIEAIKLVESGGSARCDELWIVVAEAHIQFQRLAARGLARREAQQRLAAQGSPAGWIEAFVAQSTQLGRPRPVALIDNSGSLDQTREQVQRLWHGIA